MMVDSVGKDWGVGGLNAADFAIPEYVPPITPEELKSCGLNVLDALPPNLSDEELTNRYLDILGALGFAE